MRKVFLVLAILASTVLSFAQNSGNKMNLVEGTQYMVSFPQIWASPSETPSSQPMQLFISSKLKTKVRVQTPSLLNDNSRIDREYSLEPNKVLKVSVSTNYMNRESEKRNGYGILVTSKSPISVSTYQSWNGNGELARHLPVQSWGKNYYTMNFYQDRYGSNGEYNYRPSQILIIAAKDNTVVSYTPTWDTEGGFDVSSTKKGATQTITLEKGETFLIKAKIDEMKNKEWESDLSGTIIKASKPIGVISGHTKVGILRYPDILVGLGGSSPAHFVRNNVHDAMLPIEMAGTKFVTVPCRYTSTRITGRASAEFGVEDDRGDVIRVIALEDGTTVKTMRQDGSSFKNEWVLRKGETRIMPSLEVPTYWESDKPILMGQYGKSYAKDRGVAVRGSSKGEESALGHPSVESGMPMLQYIPSTDRFVDYGVFSAPEGMDNFLNIVFKADEITKIKFDNKALNSAFGGAMRYLKGTPYACLAVSVSPGDHVIESVDPKVRWSAWTYGSLDGLTQGRAYGTPVSIDLSIPCDDSLEIQHEIVCGDVDGKVKLLPENSSCAQFFSFVIEDENNFSLDADVENLTGYKTFPFKLSVVDKKKPAFARVRVITRSGNWIVKEFRYDGIDLEFNPSEVNFGTQPLGTRVCSTVVVTNKQKTPITISDLKFNNSSFDVSPNSVQLGPNESKEIKVCGTVKNVARATDTLIAEINCTKLKYVPVEIKGDEPVFYAGDQNWGTIPAKDRQTKQVELINAGQSDIIISDYQPRGLSPYFTNITLGKLLPLILKPGQRFKYDVDYSPNGEVGTTHKLRIDYLTNATREKLYSDLQGQGSDAQLSIQPFSWLERVIDTYQQIRGILQYTGSVKIQNLGNTPATIKSVSIQGGVSTVFGWTGDSRLTDAIAPNDFREIQVTFKPFEMPMRDMERKFSSEIVVLYEVNGEPREVRSAIEGTAVQPMVTLTNQDWGSRNVNTVTTLPVYITNKSEYAMAPLTGNEGGTMDLIVDSLVIDGNQPFTWSKTGGKTISFSPSLSIGSLVEQELFVDFSPTSPGTYKVSYRLYGNVLDTAFGTLRGESPGENKVNPTDLITWIGTTTTGTVTGSAAYSTILTFKEFRGGDYILFNPAPGQSLQPFAVDPSSPFSFRIEFTPNKVTKKGLKPGQNLSGRLPYQDQTFSTQIVFEDATGRELIGEVTGEGKYLETTLRIIGANGIDIGSTSNVSFVLQPVPESIDSGSVESARMRVRFDENVIHPTEKMSFPSAESSTQLLSRGMVEIDLVTPPQKDGFLGTYQFGALLNEKTFSDVTGEYYMISKGGKVASPYVVVNVIPDVFTVIPVCANIRRVIGFGPSYSIVLKGSVVEVTTGIDATLSISSMNELGQEKEMFNGFLKKGTHVFPVTNRGLQWIVARQAGWSDVVPVFVD